MILQVELSEIVSVEAEWPETDESQWHELIFSAGGPPARWVELVIDVGLLAPLRRPVLRCRTPTGDADQTMSAPLFGRARWIGRIPDATTRVWVCPFAEAGQGTGQLRFRLVECRALSEREILGRAAARGLKALWALARGELAAADPETQNAYRRRALAPTGLAHYRRWRSGLSRAPEWSGIDSDMALAGNAPHVSIFLRGADVAALHKWRKFLDDRQPWPHWSLLPTDGPIGSVPLSALSDRSDEDLFAVFDAADQLEVVALPAVVSTHRRRRADLYYGDEELTGGELRLSLKPDWDPIFASQGGQFGRAWFASVGWARRRGDGGRDSAGADSPFRPYAGDSVEHVRRVLLSRADGPRAKPVAPALAPPSKARRGINRSVAIIIPTRDRVDLLRDCLDSVLGTAGGVAFEVIVADNESCEPATHAYFDALKLNARVRVLNSPGPFNFSAICNGAATATSADILVFLNNDIRAIGPDWLQRLVAWAVQPDVGAVGAKLLYENGRVQHAGVVLGLEGRAGHFERNLARDAAGYFGRLLAAHEVSAVTGACLAVERAKFQAVGGFDAQNLPVDLNDVDLCLGLRERGWRTVLEPRAVLVHRESASRGRTVSVQKKYEREIKYFVRRWGAQLRDDPHFHPALSLDSTTAALG